MAAALAGSARPAEAQRVVRAPEQVVSVSKGASALVVNTTAIQRFSIGDPAVAEAVVVSPTEVLVNGKTLGTTSLFLWDNTGNIKLYSVEVTADAPGLQRYLSTVLAGEKIDVIASGKPKMLEFGVADETAWRVGLSCGGRIKVYVEKLD
jgi:Flp pilus assembly secretin CpaC